MSMDKSLSPELKALEELRTLVQQRVRTYQSGILTYFDKWVLDRPHAQEGTDGESQSDIQWLMTFAHRVAKGRFVQFAERTTEGRERAQKTTTAETDVPDQIMMMSQGTHGPIRWKGLPLFKSAYDLALYTHLLDEMRPASIFEIGSGTGASALWLADMCVALGSPCHVVSLDRRRPMTICPGVTFIQGECASVADYIPATLLAEAKRPMLLIEDAHEVVGAVLRHFAVQMRPGDRIVVEDSGAKQEILANFVAWSGEAFAVDTFYTDFFGRNATSAINGFLIKV